MGAKYLGKTTAWARLSVRGKREWGDVFPGGTVPVRSIASQRVKPDGTKDAESVFAVDWKELSKEQQELALEKLSEQNFASKEDILQDILTAGLHIPRRLFASCGTTHDDSPT